MCFSLPYSTFNGSSSINRGRGDFSRPHRKVKTSPTLIYWADMFNVRCWTFIFQNNPYGINATAPNINARTNKFVHATRIKKPCSRERVYMPSATPTEIRSGDLQVSISFSSSFSHNLTIKRLKAANSGQWTVDSERLLKKKGGQISKGMLTKRKPESSTINF